VPPVENDYTPIIRQGTIEKASGILGRRKVRQSLPGAGHGEELVLIEANGDAVSAKGQTTAGERYWGSLGGWVMVDVSDHHLPFGFGYRDTDGAAGYQIDAVVTVTVTNAATAVRRRANGVRPYVEAAVRSAATGNLNSARGVVGGDTLAKFNQRLGSHSGILRGLVGTHLQVTDWLSVVITDLSIQFDGATGAHYDQLVAADRQAEVDSRTLINRQRTSVHEINLRNTWAEYLGAQVSDPLKRAVVAAAADPTVGNIKEMVEKLDEDDHIQREQFVATLNRLIDNKVIVELDDVRNTRVIIDSLQRAVGDGDSGQSRPEMIASAQDTDVAEVAEVVDDGNGRSSYGGDSNWDN
jgi:hypothetical protein